MEALFTKWGSDNRETQKDFFSLRNDFLEKDNQQKYTELYDVLFSLAHRLKSHLLNHLHFVSIFLLPDFSSL